MPTQKSHRKILFIGGIAGILMFGFCFAMVPLYSLLCKATGMNTSIAGGDLITPAAAAAITAQADMSREVTVQFTATNHMGMPWHFYPRVKSLRVHPGEKATVYFYAKNPTTNDMIAQAIPSMTPSESLGHFHKIECFCFHQQALKGGESREMALVFQIDRELPKEVHVITLAYTLFDATPKAKKQA
jgi:cytochrome c oxidase assembly protein subunit 11